MKLFAAIAATLFAALPPIQTVMPQAPEMIVLKFSCGKYESGGHMIRSVQEPDPPMNEPIHIDLSKKEEPQEIKNRRDLAERARAGRLQPADIAGATFTISNLGLFEVDAFTAIIVPPQAAILAVGAIRDRVVPVDGQPGVRPMMSMTLSCDHRVVDGATAAEFMRDLAAAIKSPHF